MKVYLAGTQGDKYNLVKDNKDLYLLESFWYVKDSHMKAYNQHHFLLDSGAFTFMGKLTQKAPDWDEYVERYAAYINKHDIKLFFELDIDEMVGLKEVERLRDKLERLTNKQSIPVWHIERGLGYWYEMLDQYNYVALGGMVSDGAVKNSLEPAFPFLLREAYKKKVKVHALGYTSPSGLKKYKFYSVDSTSWIAAQKFVSMMKYVGDGNFKTYKLAADQKGKDAKGRVMWSFYEWVKFQKYALKHL